MANHHKLLLVEPNTAALAGLRETLSAAVDLEVVGDAGLGPAALTWARSLQPDIVIVALDEPVGRPLATIQLLAQGSPTWTVLGLASTADQALFRKAVLSGATDVLVRSSSSRELRASLLQARRADVARRLSPSPDHSAAPAGSVISVVGVKGGIGKTTIAINLAVALAEETAGSCAVVDLDLPFGDVAMMLDLHPDRDITHALSEAIIGDPDRLQAQLVAGPSGVHVLAAPSLSGPPNGHTYPVPADGHLLARLLSRLASLHEYVVVDTPPGFNEVTAAALDASALALVIATPEVAAVRRTQAYLRVLQGLEYPMDKIQVVLNRAHSKTGINEREIEEILGVPIAWRVANDFAAMKAAAVGEPVVTAQPRTSLATSIRAIARQIGGLVDDPRRTPGWRAWLPQVAINTFPGVGG
jgi:pilus assembly protein CpaE